MRRGAPDASRSARRPISDFPLPGAGHHRHHRQAPPAQGTVERGASVPALGSCDERALNPSVNYQDGYSAKGWLGMLLGVRLWYGFYGSVLESEAAFNGKVDELCRELGERGKT